MKCKQIITIVILLVISQKMINAQNTPSWAKESKEQKAERLSWWTNDRFGLFIHWGVYAMPARHEWVKRNERISDEKYNMYTEYFNPDLYDPTEWAKKTKEAGMKYVVFTTKHHDGFCMWDTKHTDYKITNTPYGKDVLKPFVDAFRAEGIRVGLYYSLIDWHHPDFTVDNVHPLWTNDKSQLEKLNEGRDMNRYRQYMKDQLTELLSDFGQIDELFLDYSYPGENGKGYLDWDSEGLLKVIRKLQPQIIVDNRMDMDHTSWGWDFVTPEQFMPKEWPTVNGEKEYWETCQTFSGAWGYYRDEYSWKSVHQLIVMLIETVSKGGNLLLNVGPTARGVFDDRANNRLEGIGKWMKFHSSSIYGCTQAPDEFEAPNNCMLTYNPTTNRLYVHVLEWPFKSLHFKNLKGKVKYIQLLNDNSELRYRTQTRGGGNMAELSGENDIIISLPVEKPNVEVPVIEIILF
ncbi:alpha-L-fucosidase [Dysgonomonadaceae bacterium PH5-43]|nr:alpha-L-fucosidase [Dysgonomonadaceae bacterium PH5-43]